MLSTYIKNLILISLLIKNNFIILKMKQINLLFNLSCLKLHQFYRFRVLTTLSCVDYPELKERFELNYHLLSLDFNKHILVRITCSEFSKIFSVSLLYKSGVWLEREVWDMFGVFFINHFDLRRLLTDYGFPYHPLRKTFPLQGYSNIYYNFIIKKVVYTLNKYTQIQKKKNFSNNWVFLKN